MASRAVEGAGSGGSGTALRLSFFALAAAASATLLFWAIRDWRFAAAFAAGLIGVGGVLVLVARRREAQSEPAPVAESGTDVALVRAALDWAGENVPLVITSAADLGLVAANECFGRLHGTPLT